MGARARCLHAGFGLGFAGSRVLTSLSKGPFTNPTPHDQLLLSPPTPIPHPTPIKPPTGKGGIDFDCSEAERLFWQFIAERSDWGASLRAALHGLDSGRPWQALLRYLLLAEQGCEIAAANAAFMLQRGLGARGGRTMELAVELLHR